MKQPEVMTEEQRREAEIEDAKRIFKEWDEKRESKDEKFIFVRMPHYNKDHVWVDEWNYKAYVSDKGTIISNRFPNGKTYPKEVMKNSVKKAKDGDDGYSSGGSDFLGGDKHRVVWFSHVYHALETGGELPECVGFEPESIEDMEKLARLDGDKKIEVHHKNENKSDNSIGNLKGVLRVLHQAHHHPEREDFVRTAKAIIPSDDVTMIAYGGDDISQLKGMGNILDHIENPEKLYELLNLKLKLKE